MFNSRSACYFCLFVAFVFNCETVRSNEQQWEQNSERAFLLVGAGMILQDEPLKGIDSEVFPIPFFLYQGKTFSMRGISATYDVFGQESWTIGALARFRSDGYDADGSSDLDGMSDRRNSLDVGAELSVENSWGNISLNFLTDTLGEHDGQEARLTYTMPVRAAFGIKKLGLRPMLGLSWRSNNLNNYYYGVRASEATAIRPRYNSGDSVDPFVGVGLDYLLDERWSIFSMFRNEWLGREITDSPIVDQHSTISVILGLVYRF
jgi:outer membrane protein